MNEKAFRGMLGDLITLCYHTLDLMNEEKKKVQWWATANQKISCLFKKERELTVKLKSQNRSLKKRLAALKKESDRLNSHSLIKSEYRSPAKSSIADDQFKRKMLSYKDENYRLEREKRKLEIKYFEYQLKFNVLKKDYEEMIRTLPVCFSYKAGLGHSHPSFSGCPYKILIVGGVTRMQQQYRQLVEALGGSFEYHDGYLKTGKKRLEDKIRQCDMVLCPMRCNSRGTCGFVKKLGEQLNKPVRMLQKASLSSVSKVLVELGGKPLKKDVDRISGSSLSCF